MMQTTKTKVIFSRETWEEMKNDLYYREVIEAIEDKEAIKKAKSETEYFIDLEEYHNARMKKNEISS
jgi:hypothetical protein